MVDEFLDNYEDYYDIDDCDIDDDTAICPICGNIYRL